MAVGGDCYRRGAMAVGEMARVMDGNGIILILNGN
jgi:hypothetical protein